MQRLRIEGEKRINGEISVQGAKTAHCRCFRLVCCQKAK